MTNLIVAIATNLMIVTNTSGWSVWAPSIAEIRLTEGGRMTCPIETVCVITNVTHRNNEERSPFRFSWVVGEPEPGSVTKEMTEQTETTEVVEVKTLRFTWEGDEYAAKRERVLSRKVKRWTRKDNWVEEVKP